MAPSSPASEDFNSFSKYLRSAGVMLPSAASRGAAVRGDTIDAKHHNSMNPNARCCLKLIIPPNRAISIILNDANLFGECIVRTISFCKHLRHMLTPRISSGLAIATRYDRTCLEVLDWHEHHNLSFCFVMKGNYRETTSRGSFTCRPGDVVIKPRNMRHQNTFGQLGAVCLLLEISEELLEHSTELFEPEFHGPIHDHQLARIGVELHEELHSADRLSPMMLEAIALRSVVSASGSLGCDQTERRKWKPSGDC
jgi:hypothetical protein